MMDGQSIVSDRIDWEKVGIDSWLFPLAKKISKYNSVKDLLKEIDILDDAIDGLQYSRSNNMTELRSNMMSQRNELYMKLHEKVAASIVSELTKGVEYRIWELFRRTKR